MRLVAVLAFVGLAACENPELGIGATIGTGGASISPTVSGNVGGARVSVSR